MYLVDASVGESMLKLLRWYSGTDYPFTGDIFDILETRQDIAPLDLSGARGIPIECTVYMMAGHGAAGRGAAGRGAAPAAGPSPAFVQNQDGAFSRAILSRP